MLTATIRHRNRWIRGWSRVGLVLGLLAAIVVLGVGAIAMSEAYRQRDFDYERFACLLAENGNQPLRGDQFKAKAVGSQCGYFGPYDTYSVLQWQVFGRSIDKNGFLYIRTTDEQKHHNAGVVALWTMAIAPAALAIVFLFCWTVGWIFAGFGKAI